MRFDRGKFYDGLRTWLGELTTQQVNGINFILDSMELDSFLTRIEWPAYMFATVYPETAHTFQPIHEYGGHNYFVRRYGSQTAVGHGLGNLTEEEGATYAGEGDVQLTGHANYKKATLAVRKQYPELVAQFEARTKTTFDLEKNPAEAGDPAIAYAVMSYGMRSGMFTGKSLATYTKATGFDSLNARRIINGDIATNGALIAGYYKHFLGILTDSLITADATDSTAAEDPAGSQVSPQSEPSKPTVDDPGPGASGPEPETDATGDGDDPSRQKTGDGAEISHSETTDADGSKKSETSLSVPAADAPGILGRVKSLGDKYLDLQGQLDKFGIANPLAATSKGTWITLALKGIFAVMLAIFGFIKDNIEYIAAALVVVGIIAIVYTLSRQRVEKEKAGVPLEILKAAIPPQTA